MWRQEDNRDDVRLPLLEVPLLGELALPGQPVDWAGLPHPALSRVFRFLLEPHARVEALVPVFRALTVCKAWYSLLAKDQHVSGQVQLARKMHQNKVLLPLFFPLFAQVQW
jgi:hypothetical protein